MKLEDRIASTNSEEGVMDITINSRYAPVSVRVTYSAKKAVGWHRLTPRDSIIKLSNGEISISQRRLYQSSGNTHLTPREIEVLVYLNEKRGEFVSNREFDEKFDFGINAARVYISQIRKKLNQDPNNSDILSAHGKGYMLKPVTD